MSQVDQDPVWTTISELLYLFTYKPTLAISRDPKLVRHDSGSKVLEKNRKKYQL